MIRMALFWMIYFFILRAVFILYNQGAVHSEQVSVNEVFQVFYHALRVDMATAGYLLSIPLLLLSLAAIYPSGIFIRIINLVNLLLVIILALILGAELGIYPEWKSKLSAKSLAYLRRPDEAFFSISANLFFSLLGISVFVAYGGWYLYKRLVIKGFYLVRVKIQWVLLFFIVSAGILGIGARGGVGPIPVSPSASYFSSKPFLNHAAVNSGFNIAISILESNKYNYENPFKYFPEKDIDHITSRLFEYPEDDMVEILDTIRPNVVVLLLESWSADLIASLGGEPGITPEFESLVEDGILFTDFYSSGSRSQQAIASILSGFPATPYTTVTENADKYSNLPSLVKLLKQEDYYTSFYFGGELTYGNIKAFLYNNEFDNIVEQKDFDDNIPAGRLGIHDEFLFSRYLQDYQSMEEPFFSMIFTLSSHSPYDQPKEDVLDWGGTENAFINSAYYTDSCLGVFFDEARKLDWFSNTLFIIAADHSHNTYRNHPLESFNYHQIPLLFYGDVLKPELMGTKNDLISMTPDIPVTLMKQMDIEPVDFIWGKNLFNPLAPGYAYFELHYAFGWKRPTGYYVYSWDWDHYYESWIDPEAAPEEEQQVMAEGKAYLQKVFQAFLDL